MSWRAIGELTPGCESKENNAKVSFMKWGFFAKLTILMDLKTSVQKTQKNYYF
jgi:hypothetical protein